MTRTVDASTPVVVLAPGFHGHGIARSLGRLGVPVFAVHGSRHSPAALSRYSRENFELNLNACRSEEGVRWLLELGQRIGDRPILIPTDDTSCLFVADHASALETAFSFPNPPLGLARKLSDKKGMYYLCREHSIPTPEALFPESRSEVEAFAESALFPVMLKGIHTMAFKERTGVKMVLTEDARALLDCYDKIETPGLRSVMVQEYIPGGSEAVWMFDGYFDEKSDCLFGLTGKKIRQYPAHMGVTSLGVCLSNSEVADQTRRFMKATGYRGILDIGYKYDARSSEYKLLDVNPRIGSTFRLFVDSSGMDVARALYLDLTGQPFEVGRPREGRKWMVENFDIISSIRHWREGDLRPGQWMRSYRGLEEASWFAHDDPRPFFGMWRRSIQWGFGRRFGGQ